MRQRERHDTTMRKTRHDNGTERQDKTSIKWGNVSGVRVRMRVRVGVRVRVRVRVRVMVRETSEGEIMSEINDRTKAREDKSKMRQSKSIDTTRQNQHKTKSNL
jgi:hypothetical protein